ncbi:NrsF family protein [Brevundimonas sp.]|jgi:hypothetical protein|uniref:NrsF family protein n=1 Tax=Brevundimonas sp. TaxID=1871086 RepID=UPI0037C18BA9
MKTDDLIDALAAGVEPVRPARPSAPLLAGAGAAAVLAVVLILGVRPDLHQAMQGPAMWMKALYTAALAAAALWLATLLGRPGVRATPALIAVAVVAGVAVLWGGMEMMTTPADQRMAHWMGRSSSVCGLNILMASLFAAPLVFLSARRLAPTRPTAAGAALGLAAGAIAATAYGLHCAEETAAFVATWYTLGVAAAGLIGAAVGRFALRW